LASLKARSRADARSPGTPGHSVSPPIALRHWLWFGVLMKSKWIVHVEGTRMRTRRLFGSWLIVLTMVFGSLVAPVVAKQATPSASPVASEATPVTGDKTATPGEVDLDVLFVGAHPDDEAFGLATYRH